MVDVNGLSRFGPVPPEDAEQLPVGGDQGAVPISEGLTRFTQPRFPRRMSSLYRAGRLVIRKVLKTRIWGVPPAGGPLLHGSLEPPIGHGLICSQETKCTGVFYDAYRFKKYMRDL